MSIKSFSAKWQITLPFTWLEGLHSLSPKTAKRNSPHCPEQFLLKINHGLN